MLLECDVFILFVPPHLLFLQSSCSALSVFYVCVGVLLIVRINYFQCSKSQFLPFSAPRNQMPRKQKKTKERRIIAWLTLPRALLPR